MGANEQPVVKILGFLFSGQDPGSVSPGPDFETKLAAANPVTVVWSRALKWLLADRTGKPACGRIVDPLSERIE
jgi:hypothetical protein